jgi:hypothetical protein
VAAAFHRALRDSFLASFCHGCLRNSVSSILDVAFTLTAHKRSSPSIITQFSLTPLSNLQFLSSCNTTISDCHRAHTLSLPKMGLAPLLVDTYRTYKKGTGNFVQWLAETARTTGTVNKIFKDDYREAAPPTRGRLKGAARKEAKKAGLTQDAIATCQIPAKSFLTLATAIASDPRTSVPRTVFATLRAVIRGRKDCAVWYAMTSDCEDSAAKESNASHKHFIELLENVFEILKVKQPRAGHQPPTTTKEGPVYGANMYELLEDEDLSQGEEMPEAIESPIRPAREKVSYKLEPTDADVSFAIFCFLKDVTHLRLAVRRTWREFSKGDIGLQAAALTMNTALAMIEKLSNEFEEAHPRFKDSETQKMHLNITGFVHDSYNKGREGSAFIDAGDEDDDPFAYKEGKQALRSDTVMCTHTMDLVLSIFFNEGNPGQCRLTDDEKRFLKCVSQLASAESGMMAPGSYMVQKAASTMLYGRQLNSWVILSLQIFWDMQRELGSRLPVGRALLDKVGQQIAGSYQVYLDVRGLEDVGKSHEMFRENIVGRKSCIEALIHDAQLQQEFDRQERGPGQLLNILSDFSLLKCDPALCGLLLACIRDRHHRIGIDMASNQGQILVAAHLYNAVQHYEGSPKDLQWADMDWLIEQQGSNWIFMGEKPKQGSAFGKHVNLVLGFPAHKFTQRYKGRNREPEVQTVFGATRRLECHARRCELGTNREPRYKKPLRESKAKKDILVMMESLVNENQTKPLGVGMKLSPLDKLRVFKLAIEKDESALAFDVMDLNLRCIRLLQAIQKHALAMAPRDYPASECTGGLSMNTVIVYMLYDLGGEQRDHPSIFPAAAGTLRKLIQSEGGHCLAKASEWQQEMKVKLEDCQSEEEPSFENPCEDTMGVQWRNMFSDIFFQDENGDFRMPYGPPV